MSADEPAVDGWAPKVDRLAKPAAPDEATNINVGGRRVAGPMQGFGKLWKKTYRVTDRRQHRAGRGGGHLAP